MLRGSKLAGKVAMAAILSGDLPDGRDFHGEPFLPIDQEPLGVTLDVSGIVSVEAYSCR